jgi:hypothetical protein
VSDDDDVFERPARTFSEREEPRPVADVLAGAIGAGALPAAAAQPDDEPAEHAQPEPEPEQPRRPAHPLRVTPAGGLRLVGSGDDEFPAWMAHAEFDESRCPGTLRLIERGHAIWVVECDREPCRMAFGLERWRFDPNYRLTKRRELACLPQVFIGRAVMPVPGNTEARKLISAFVERWGQRDCPRPPMMVGPPGRGKTHLITAALLLLIERHEADVWYLTVSDLFDEAKRNMESKTPVRPVFDRAATVPVLALDDLGADDLRDWGRSELQALIDRRHRRGLPIIGATNVPTQQWDQRFGERVASRLHDLSQPVFVSGDDWRRKR